MTTSNGTFADTLGTPRLPLRINPAVVVGLGDFGGTTLHLLADRLRPAHPALFESMGRLWLTSSGWQTDLSDPAPDPTRESTTVYPHTPIPPHPLARAFDGATSQATVAALGRAGYDVGMTLDTVVVACVDDPFTQGALWPLLDLIRAQPPLRRIPKRGSSTFTARPRPRAGAWARYRQSIATCPPRASRWYGW